MTAQSSSQAVVDRLEAISGKPLIVRVDSEISGHATIRVAASDAPAHLLRYKPEHEPTRDYLIAFQCGLALRAVQTKPDNRFQVAERPTAREEAVRMVREHLESGPATIPDDVAPGLAGQFIAGLGTQLRSMPIAIRVDRWLFREFPALREQQRQNVVLQLQESLQGLGPQVKAIAPRAIVDANLGMNAAFAKSWSTRWNDPALALPFVSAGYDAVGDRLLELAESGEADPDSDRAAVVAWAKQLKLDRWFQVIDKRL